MKAFPKRTRTCFIHLFVTDMKTKSIVKIEITCRDAAELQKAKEAILYHLETLNPKFSTKPLNPDTGGTARLLTVEVIPIDPACFEAEEACDIIRLTLAQSLTFTTEWKCTLHTTN